MPAFPLISHCARRAVAVAASVSFILGAASASAQTPADLYTRAQEREAAAVAATPPSPATLRAVARAYENIVRQYPKSGYCDNALWQGAGLLQLAFDTAHDPADRDQAVRLLRWLQKEYPSSSYVRQVPARVAALLADPAPAPSDPPSPARPTTPTSGAPEARMVALTRSDLPNGDRVTIELSREVPYVSDRVSNPDRVFFDFANATAAAALVEQARSVVSPLIKAIRVGRPTEGVTRVVFDLGDGVRFSAFPLYGPFRLVVDLEAADGSAPPSPTTAAPSPSPLPPATSQTRPPASEPTRTPPPNGPAPVAPSSTSKGDYSLARQLGLGVSRIVIDAGHGGHDPGAQANGIDEAELVLDIALRLERLLLDHPGVEVVLTRRTNEFIPLEERTAIANREGADLFLSIHANATRQTTVRGIETYFLNFATTPDAEAVAARENAASAQTMGTLPAILKTIALNNKLEESRELASLMQTSLVRRLRTQTPGMKDLGVKQAPFVVLIGAQMPSVLTEISFLTNRSEATLLKKTAYRQQIAQALCDALLKYQTSLKKVTTISGAGRQR